MLDAIVMVNPPSYDRFLEVDKLVRDFRVPSPLDEHKLSDAKPRFLVMQRALVSSSRDIGMLFSLLSSRTLSRWDSFSS